MLAAGHSIDPARWREAFEAAMGRIAGRIARYEPRLRAERLVLGLLSDLPRKNCWTIAEWAGETSPHGCPGLDAVFAASDVTASGAVLELRASGRQVPDDVAVIGFDDSIVARHTDPQLTSVRQPIEEMGRTMATLLLDEIAHRGKGHREVILPTELIVRESA
ncbi:substrate-binding domain-containing protein [Streptomyces sp. NPDC056910]|uniref:substrate-binding domain-containing protein n=1 Tax=Streptomyces sp. NPDC056910 TaxID=3345964 RepID=UPI0036775099